MSQLQHDFSSSQDSRSILDEVNTELALLSLRSDELRKQMTSLYYRTDPVGNRRVKRQERRMHDERRRIVRPDGDRRNVRTERRLPLETRCEKLETELSMLSQRSQELADVRRKLYTSLELAHCAGRLQKSPITRKI